MFSVFALTGITMESYCHLPKLAFALLLLLSASKEVLTVFICPIEAPVEVGARGSVLRMRVIANECSVAGNSTYCHPKFNVSLARGELYRSDANVDMRLYGSQLCLRNKRVGIGLDGTTQKTHNCERNCYSTSLKNLPRVVTKVSCYNSTNGLEICPATGSTHAKTYLNITISETNLATEGDLLGISSFKNCTLDYGTNNKENSSVILTFEDCLEVRGEDTERCVNAQVYIGGVINDTLHMKDDTKYQRVVMLGLNSYLQLWFKGETLCIGTNTKTRSMNHRTKKPGRFEKEKISQGCEKSCHNIRDDPIQEFIYHTEAFVDQLKTDTNATKYIKVTAKLPGKKSSGILSKSEPMSVLCFLLVNLATLFL